MTTSIIRSHLNLSLLALAVATTALPAHASPTQGTDHGHAAAIGTPGQAAQAARTVEVVMGDNYFEPEQLVIAPGETVRFVVRNEGSIVHEFNIGTPELHRRHQPEMRMMLEHGMIELDRIHHDRMTMDMGNGHAMDHSEPNSVLLEPGQTAEVVWRFTGADPLEFACNMPGHYESGMVGPIRLTQASPVER
jgi:uncharacterized cupredoxin-like copper-binding protein